MSSWRDEYIQALHERDEREKASYQRVDAELIQAFTYLLEYTAALEAEKAALPTATAPAVDTKKKTITPPPTTNDPQLQLRSELAETLRSNGQLQTRVKAAEAELVKLRAKTRADSQSIVELERERVVLTRKVRDRGDEHKVKGKLLEDLQDEIVALEMQLNMSEQTAKKLRDENKELIDRWMASKRREAEEMNEAFRE